MSKNDSSHGDNISRLVQQLLDEAVKVLLQSLPSIQKIAGQVFELVFVPKAIARQLVLAVALETGAVTINQVSAIFKKFYSNFSSNLRLIRQLEQQQQKVETQDEWMDIAEQIDNIQSNDTWRSEPTCCLYESNRIQSRVDEFVHLIRRNNVFDLIFTLRGGIARNKFGLLHEGLFSKALSGTKVLVETYHNVVCAALQFVCDAETCPGEEPIPTEARLAFFNETRHSYGRTALMLSGGAALGFYHVGVVKALMDNGVLPRVISGASAGSILAAMVGTRTDEECKRDMFVAEGTVGGGHSGSLMLDFFRPMGTTSGEMVDGLDDGMSHGSSGDSSGDSSNSNSNNNNNDNNPIKVVLKNTAGAFSDRKKTCQIFAPIGIRKFTSFLYDVMSGHRRAKDVLKSDTEHFRRCCRANVGDFTFQEAFDRTGRILNIIVSPQNRSDPPRLLNYLTSPHVLVWSAAVASSSLPGVFEPNKLLVKDANGVERYESATLASFVDGSMEADLPMQQLSEMFNVNHFIISQANAHAVMFSSTNVEKSVWSRSLMHGVLVFLKKQVREWIGDMIELIGGQRAAPTWDTKRGLFSQFFTQEYEGRDIDIGICPWASHRSIFSAFLHCIYNPSQADFQSWARAAERETWRFIPKIKSHVAEEMMLDQCVQRLRKQLLTERRMKFGSAGVDNANAEQEKMMLKSVPSFFTSASLVNMSGLCITDQHSNHPDNGGGDSCEAIFEGGRSLFPHSSPSPSSIHQHTPLSNDIPTDIPMGWKGMGLRGNFSSGNFKRLSSAGSGLFLIDGESEDEMSTYSSPQQQQHEIHTSTQEPGEISHVKEGLVDDGGDGKEGGIGYLKTTSMADFYYRKTSHGSLAGSSFGG